MPLRTALIYTTATFALLFSSLDCAAALPEPHVTISTVGNSNDTSPRLDSSRQGWTSSPNIRGTADIIWSCISTIFLCCWSILCLNVPASSETEWVKLRRKAFIFCLGIFAPEIVALSAVAQYFSALQSIKDFTAEGISGWSLQHGFFADMGGFILETRDFKPFPINTKQLLWLIQRRYVSLSPAVLSQIKDKNKVDGMMRFIMILQMIWFLANFLTRIIQGLAITLLELTTVAFIYAILPTMLFWRHKPADVEIAMSLVADRTLKEILLTAGNEVREPYSTTPLDFIDRNEWAWSLYWSHFRHALRSLGISAGTEVRPLNRFSNFTITKFPAWVFSIGVIYYLGFVAIFISAWNRELPTETEQLLFRMASLACFLAIFVGEIVNEVAFRVWPHIKTQGNNHGDPRPSELSRAQPRTIWDWLRNNSASQDPLLTLPLRTVIPLIVVCVIYLIARAYIIVQDVLDLRSLPQSCYEMPDWQQYIPHIG